MTDTRYLDLVDARDFRTLFIDELGWDNPDQPNLHLEVDDTTYTLTQVAGYKGLRIWRCPVLPLRKVQRVIDVLVGKDSHERLIIFTDETRQEWRWPRRAQLSGTNAKLLIHEHTVGQPNPHLTQRLKAIELDFDEDLPLVALLDKMRDAFDVEAETASVRAARLMGTLYTELDTLKVPEHDATLLLARLLFLLFGDDADMWDPDLFDHYIRDHTTPTTLHTDLHELFNVLKTPENERPPGTADAYTRFRYINGGLYADPLAVPALTPAFRAALLEACEFDWAIISPAVFGSMFQTVKSKEARRHGGEHYTTEENILKTIRPLFLDEYADRFEAAWDDKAQLTKLHNELGQLRFLDPACGCGNFLIVAYRELRALELDILKRRRDLDLIDKTSIKSAGIDRSQLSLDVTGEIQVTLDHFYGIEIDECPARIAETAMLLVDHLANQRMAQEFGQAPDRLPISTAPTIKHGNALRTNWTQLLQPSDDVIILGNPPFHGHDSRTPEQAAELRDLWGKDIGRIDYVTGWHAKAIDYFNSRHHGRWAFVSTNSIVQGQPVELVFRAILGAGWKILFAHRTIAWTSEADDPAGVHCVIVGFARSLNGKPRLFDYENTRGRATERRVTRINPYLVDGPDVLVGQRRSMLSPGLPRANYGSRPNDGGNLIIEPGEYTEAMADPIAAKYIRKFVGARELLHGSDRWCLWLTELDPQDVTASDLLRRRINAVRETRLKSGRAATRQGARIPQLFDFISQPSVDYLCIPSVVSESRSYFTVARFSADVITSNLAFTAPDPDGLLFGLLSSSMFLVWQKTVGGRLESRLRFSNTVVWNNFPLPPIVDKARKNIIKCGQAVLDVRAERSERSLAEQYNPRAMHPRLVEAHAALDAVVDKAFGAKDTLNSESERQSILFRRYAELVSRV